jgi:hypothetical protein
MRGRGGSHLYYQRPRAAMTAPRQIPEKVHGGFGTALNRLTEKTDDGFVQMDYGNMQLLADNLCNCLNVQVSRRTSSVLRLRVGEDGIRV